MPDPTSMPDSPQNAEDGNTVQSADEWKVNEELKSMNPALDLHGIMPDNAQDLRALLTFSQAKHTIAGLMFVDYVLEPKATLFLLLRLLPV